MTREEKSREIELLTEALEGSDVMYITDIAGLDAAQTTNLRRLCFKADIKLNVVKNTLLRKAMEKSSKNFEDLYPTLKIYQVMQKLPCFLKTIQIKLINQVHLPL